MHVFDHGFELARGFGLQERIRFRVQIHENETMPGLARKFRQTAIANEIGMHVIDTGGANQPAVEIVGPGVIGTGEFLRVAALFDQRHTAMAADV